MPTRRRDPVSVPRHLPSSHVRHDYGIDESISRMGYLSNAVLEDQYDAAARSRGKDHQLMRTVNDAIVTTDLHASRPSVGSRRGRACSVPPVSSQQTRTGTFGARPVYPKVAGIHSPPVVLVSDPYYTNIPASSINTCYAGPVVLRESRESPWIVKARAGSVPPAGGVRLVRAGSVPPRRRAVVVDNSPVYQAVGTEGLKAHNPRLIRSLRARSVGPLGPPAGSYDYEYESQGPYRPATLGRNFGSRRTVGALPRSMAYDLDNRIGRLARCMSETRDLDQASARYPTIPDVKQRALSRHPRLVFVPTSGIGPSNRAKAAIIGSKMEAEDAGKKKRPRSSYAASKYRGITLDPNEDGIYYNNYHYNNSGALHSSRPPLPKPTDRKAIRDVDGFTKPRNLMSWQYRVESSLSPDDLMDQPPSLSRVRNQLNEAKEKLDRQRQIMDRHKDLDAVGALTKRNDEATRGSRTRSYH